MCVRICFDLPRPLGFKRFCFWIPCYYLPSVWRGPGPDPGPYRHGGIEFDGKPPQWAGDAYALAGVHGILKHGGLSAEATRALEVAGKEMAAGIQKQLGEGGSLTVGE
jgi:hypothetical protein